jgi:DNA-binding XRE family transcriptional regulator
MTDAITTPFGDALTAAEARGLHRQKIANAIGVPPQTIIRIAAGERPLGWIARKLASTLDKDVRELFPDLPEAHSTTDSSGGTGGTKTSRAMSGDPAASISPPDVQTSPPWRETGGVR